MSIKPIKETKNEIHLSHPWPFPISNGKKVITPLTRKVKKEKNPFERKWVPALF